MQLTLRSRHSVCSRLSTSRRSTRSAMRWQVRHWQIAARLGQLADEETGYGNAADKFEKNRFAAEDVLELFQRAKDRRRRQRFEEYRGDRKPARRRCGDHPIDEPDFDGDLQDHHRDKIPQHDRAFAASRCSKVHCGDNANYA